MGLPIYELLINENESSDLEVDYVALVDKPAIERDFMAFKDEFVEPNAGENKNDFLGRCISYVINEGKDNEQAIAICNSMWESHFAADKISIDYDDTLSTSRGKELAKKLIDEGNTLYIISARDSKDGMLKVASDLGIPESRVYATGSNKVKVEKVKELGISKHIDNNQDVIDELGSIGQKFTFQSFAIVNEDRRIISGPAMLADVPIFRSANGNVPDHYVVFKAETIYAIAQKFIKKGFGENFNLMHDSNQKTDGVSLFESFIVDSKRGILPMKGFEDAQDGSWFISAKVDNEELWQRIKSGEFRGFSVEGMFQYKKEKLEVDYESALEEIKNILNM